MFIPVIGRSCSGKSAYLYSVLDNCAKQGNKCLYIVPEQFSFEAEKSVLNNVSKQAAVNIEVISFSHMATKLIEKYSPKHLPFISNNGKKLIMNLVLDDLWDRLKIYSNVKNRSKLSSELLKTDAELKQSNIDFSLFDSVNEKSDDKSLSLKLGDIGLILGVYNAELSLKYSDKASAVSTAANLLSLSREYNSYTVAIDEFSGFTADELSVLEQLFIMCENVYISFCLDNNTSVADSSFDLPCQSLKSAKELAAVNNVKIKSPVYLTDSFYHSDDLFFAEQNLFSDEHELYTGNERAVKVFKCDSLYDECETAAVIAKKLVTAYGYRFSDIAVIERTSGSYSFELENAFIRNGLSVYLDKKRSIACSPPVMYALALAENAFFKISSDAILRLLRSGMTEYADADIDAIDNYILMYAIDNDDWLADWQCNPEGLGIKFNVNSTALLNKLNLIRAEIVDRILNLRETASELNCSDITKLFYNTLCNNDLPSKLIAFADELSATDKPEEADAVVYSWNTFVEILSDMNDVAGARYISPKRYYELLTDLTSATETGVAPTEIDCIKIGSADRIRLVNTKAVIIVGANEGVFPVAASSGGIFSDSERQMLMNFGIPITDNMDFLSKRERYISYRAFTYARERMYVLYSKKNTDGSGLMPSEIIDRMAEIFPSDCFSESDDAINIDKITCRQSAFRYLAANFFNDSPVISSLFAYLNVNGEKERINSLEHVAAKSLPLFTDKSKARQLYGNKIRISPSKLETYYSCPFEFFCKYGLNAKPRKQARMSANQNGLAVHYVLERIINELGSKKLAETNEEIRRSLTQKYLKEYSDIFLSGLAGRNSHMTWLLNSYTVIIEEILSRLADEFKNSEFVTYDTELSIGDTNNGISPYTVKCDDNVSVSIVGTVDRVDILDKNGKKYLRVVDYKTGGKIFQLRDVFSGLNTQMLIYLMCLWQQGGRRYNGEIVPAGVLYVPAEIGELALSRNANEDDIIRKSIENAKMNGILLNDVNVLIAMGAQSSNSFLPVKINENCEAVGSVISLEQFNNLHKLIDRKISEMGNGIINGNISPIPFLDKEHQDTCTYCDYKSVCLHGDNDLFNTPEYIPNDELFRILTEGDGIDA